MKRNLLFVAAAAVMAVGSAFAQNEQIMFLRNDKQFNQFSGADIENIDFTGTTNGFSAVNINKKDGSTTSINLSSIDSMVVRKTGIPEIYVNLTDYPQLTDLIKSNGKDFIYAATLSMNGNGMYKDLAEQEVEFRGRGNSTWNMPKTPYRFKMAKKAAVCDLPKAKSFALIANWIDCTEMRNMIAFQIAEYFKMPFHNHGAPVKVYLNGNYRGLYMITEKIGVGGGSVDIDEYTGMLFEMDSNYDEDYRFTYNLSGHYSTSYGNKSTSTLPVMIKDPDLTEICDSLGTTPSEYFSLWREDMTKMLTAVMTTPNDESLSQYIDVESAVNFFLVNGICNNHEMKHPKSFYIHKPSLEEGEVYRFGPVWDFDWSFTFDGVEGAPYNSVMVGSNGDCGGYTFLKALFKNNEFRTLYEQKLNDFIENGYPQLQEWMNEYKTLIGPYAVEDGLMWPNHTYASWCIKTSAVDFYNNFNTLSTWIDNRLNYMKNHTNFGLYQ